MIGSSDLSKLLSLSDQCIHNWVGTGIITPARRGGRGQGNCHQFSYQQALCLAYLAALYSGRQGCKTSYIRSRFEQFSKLDGAAAWDLVWTLKNYHRFEDCDIGVNINEVAGWFLENENFGFRFKGKNCKEVEPCS